MKFPECVECGATLIPELPHCPQCGKPVDSETSSELRCECGFLLCKLKMESVEIKCRRCRRLVEIPIEGIEDRFERNKEKQAAYFAHRAEMEARGELQPNENRGPGQFCPSCGKFKTSVVYGKCIDCRTESIKIQYRSKQR